MGGGGMQQKNPDFFVIDWEDELTVGEQIYFIAFPNPVNDKLRDFVQHIVKIIAGPKDREEQQKIAPAAAPQRQQQQQRKQQHQQAAVENQHQHQQQQQYN